MLLHQPAGWKSFLHQQALVVGQEFFQLLCTLPLLLKVYRLDMYEEKYKPIKGVNYLTKTGRFRVRIWWLDLTPGLEGLVDQNCDYFNMNLCDALFLHIQGKCIFDHLYHVFKSGTFMNLVK